MNQALTDREADLMRVLWDHGPCSVAEVREQLADPLARNTVLTMLRILEEKGFIDHTAEGRSHRYFAVVAENAARKHAVNHLVGKLFRGSSELLFAHLVSSGKLKAADVARLKSMIENAGKPTARGSKT
jgi:BlaI family transcriptional regulator, penicillinase repressor